MDSTQVSKVLKATTASLDLAISEIDMPWILRLCLLTTDWQDKQASVVSILAANSCGTCSITMDRITAMELHRILGDLLESDHAATRHLDAKLEIKGSIKA